MDAKLKKLLEVQTVQLLFYYIDYHEFLLTIFK